MLGVRYIDIVFAYNLSDIMYQPKNHGEPYQTAAHIISSSLFIPVAIEKSICLPEGG
jgi:hypothetical protein